MKSRANPPVYSQVAFDIATKIATGEIKEQSKFTGRSLMSTQYSVSQETIRRAFKLLSDMGIISVEKNIGATVISREKAITYIDKFRTNKDVRALKQELHELSLQRDQINARIASLIDQILDLNDRFRHSDPLRNYEFQLLPESSLVGKTIAESEFRKKTDGTIVAIRSEGKIILSPQPSTVFKPYDVLVVAGRPDVVEQVMEFVK